MAKIQREIHSIKNPESPNNITRIPILSDNDVIMTLRPIPSVLFGEAQGDARLMAEWRNNNKESFFSWINATEKSTITWLEQYYQANDQDIIFMIETPDKTPFGHLALYNFSPNLQLCEFGRVVRGLHKGPVGGMTLAVQCVLSWVVAVLDVKTIFLEVFQDNRKAISLYERCGFTAMETIPLKKISLSNNVRWTKISDQDEGKQDPERFALRMEISAEQVKK